MAEFPCLISSIVYGSLSDFSTANTHTHSFSHGYVPLYRSLVFDLCKREKASPTSGKRIFVGAWGKCKAMFFLVFEQQIEIDACSPRNEKRSLLTKTEVFRSFVFAEMEIFTLFLSCVKQKQPKS